jgi:hypothetical protein
MASGKSASTITAISMAIILTISPIVVPVYAAPTQLGINTISSVETGSVGYSSDEVRIQPADLDSIGPATFNGEYTPTGTSPVERKKEAVSLVTSLNTTGPGDLEQRKQFVLDRLNQTIDSYRGDWRLRSQKDFVRDANSISRLGRFDGGDGASIVENATKQILIADKNSALVAIKDARRALEMIELDRGKRKAARTHLRNAQRSLDRANRTLRNANHQKTTKQIHARAKAVRATGKAFKHANKVLKFSSESSTPNVTIRTIADPPRNGTKVNRTIWGTVESIYPVTNVTVTLSGGVEATIPSNVTSAPASNATFAFHLVADRQILSVNVTATSPSSQIAKGQRLTGTDTLALDGDGLSSTYETNVSLTDPLDFDSDSSLTEQNESNNGIPDGGEDFDDDGIETYFEIEYETDPFSDDTDADQLRDDFELEYQVSNPLEEDSDGDGVNDTVADPDGDGLQNYREQAMGTSPLRADSDGDTLTDGKEAQLTTNATALDTDHDYLNDGEELVVKTDPKNQDSDGDGVLDGNESFTTETSNQSLGISVSITGNGDVASKVTIANGTTGMFERVTHNGVARSPVAQLTTREEFEAANVTLRYDDSGLPESAESNIWACLDASKSG